MTRDVWKEIDELKANQEALAAEWERTKSVVKGHATELAHLSAAIKTSAEAVEGIAAELKVLVNG